MREKLNDNPIAQIAVIGVLLVAAAIFLLGKSGGGAEEEEAGSAAADAAVAEVASELEAGQQTLRLPPPGSGTGAPPAPPRAVVDAFDAGETVAILFVRDGGIDDRLVTETVDRLDSIGGVATFVVPTRQLVRYVSIAQGVDLNRVPALVVIKPKGPDEGYDPASVHYGFQSAQSIVQAVVDARYHGGTLPYHP
jgi:type II secretory pathway pseudopilin PulG